MDKKTGKKGRLELGKETQVRTKSRSRAPLWINLAREMLFPGGSDDKESACNLGDSGSISGLGRYPGEGNGYPL